MRTTLASASIQRVRYARLQWRLRPAAASDEAAHVAETVDELRRDCDHRWVMIRPSRPGPDGWAKRCRACSVYVDISAGARAEAAAEYGERAD